MFLNIKKTFFKDTQEGDGEIYGESNLKLTICKIDSQWEFVV